MFSSKMSGMIILPLNRFTGCWVMRLPLPTLYSYQILLDLINGFMFSLAPNLSIYPGSQPGDDLPWFEWLVEDMNPNPWVPWGSWVISSLLSGSWGEQRGLVSGVEGQLARRGFNFQSHTHTHNLPHVDSQIPDVEFNT